MQAPPDVNGGDTEVIGTATEAVATHEAEKQLVKRGVGPILTKVATQGLGLAVGTAFAVFDPSLLGDGTRIGNIQRANATKIQRINQALNKR